MLVQLTHLTDFSYLDRLMTNMPILAWVIYRVWATDRFKSLSLRNVLKFRLQTIVTYMVMGALLAFLLYDGIVTRIKYEEGFYFNESTGVAGPTPSSQYSEHNKDMVFVADATLNVVFTLKNSALFLLIATFAQVARKECKSEKFMSSREFTAYTIWSAVSVIGYPTMQLVFNAYARKLYATVMPQVFYSFETMVTVLLCQLTVFRLHKLRAGLPVGSSTRYRLEHYCTMLHAISVCGVVDTFGLLSINADILNEDNRVIYKSKLLTDMFTRCFSFGICLVFIPITVCLYPGQRLAVRENTTQMSAEATKMSGTGTSRMDSPRRTPRAGGRTLGAASGAKSQASTIIEMPSFAGTTSSASPRLQASMASAASPRSSQCSNAPLTGTRPSTIQQH